MQQLQQKRVWSVWSGPRKECVQPNGERAIPDDPTTLVDFSEASNCLYRLTDGTWPVDHSIALSLDAAGIISIALLNCYSEDKGIEEGAARWAEVLASYTERCYRSDEGISVRILCRGSLPDPKTRGILPARVLLQVSGFVTLTCWRISPRPVWRPDPGGEIKDCTGALAQLLTDPQRQAQTLRQEQVESEVEYKRALVRELEARLASPVPKASNQSVSNRRK